MSNFLFYFSDMNEKILMLFLNLQNASMKTNYLTIFLRWNNLHIMQQKTGFIPV